MEERKMAPKPNPSKPTPGPSKAKPDEPKAKPGEPMAKPGEPQAKPGEPMAKPGEPKAKPGEPKAKPGEPKAKPGEPKAKPGASKAKRGASKRKPGAAKTPKPGAQQPKQPTLGPNKPNLEALEKDTPAPTPETPSAPTAAEQYEDKLGATKNMELARADILLISTLWSIEVVFILTEALKSSLFLGETQGRASQSDKVHFLAPTKIDKLIVLVLTTVSMPVIAFISDGRKKLIYYLSLVCISLILTAVMGLVALISGVIFLERSIMLPQALWPPLCVLRYWLIFHQKFPLSVVQTRIVVTSNIFFILLAEHITAVWVSLRKFDWVVYIVAWSIVFVLVLIHLGIVFVFKPYMNKTEDDVNVVQKVYVDSGLLDSFNARQTTQHVVLFLCLIFPSMMMSTQKAAMTHIFKTLAVELGVFAEYRIDLVVSLVCLPAVAGLLMWSTIRQEMQDLLVIGVAHLLNILFCAFLLALIIIYSGTRDNLFPFPALRGSVFTIFIYTETENEGLIVRHENEVKFHSGFSGGSISTFFAPNGSTIWVTGKFPNRSVVFDKNMTVTSNEAYYIKNRKLTKIDNFCEFFKPVPQPGPSIILLVSGLAPCGDGPEFNDAGTRVRFNGECHSAKMKLSFRDPKTQKDVVPDWTIDVPVLGKVKINQVTNLSRFESISYHATYYKDGNLHWNGNITTESKKTLDDHPYTLISPEPLINGTNQTIKIHFNLLPSYELVDLPWPYQWAKSISVGLSFTCFAIGVASASYIHFVWIQCPFEHRVRMLAVFFAVNFLGAWASDFFLENLRQLHFIILLVFLVIGGIWHASSTIYFYQKLRTLNDEEKKKIKQIQF